MPDLRQSLHGRDYSDLQVIAGLWGLELKAGEARAALQELCAQVLEPGFVGEMVAGLPPEAYAALADLAANAGRMPWSLFTRRYGEVREMGTARRDRERPYQNPGSPAEFLWYRAFFARAFFDTPNGPLEFAYIPDDLFASLPPLQGKPSQPIGRPASPGERAHPYPVNDRLLDHACTLLAALRLGLPQVEIEAVARDWESGPLNLRPQYLQDLLAAAGLVDEAGLPAPEPAREFLGAPRAEALALLARAWLHSPQINELRWLPGLVMEGDWRNDPLQARQTILDFVLSIPSGSWWSLSSLVHSVRQEHPDYQRPAGDYDSWFIRNQRTGEFLRGFESWDAVDGELIRFLLCGPMHWLGLIDLAGPEAGQAPAAFRHSEWSARLLAGEAPPGLPVEGEALLVSGDGRLRLPRLVPRAVRYQIARFADWEAETPEAYAYRITPDSLQRARASGLLPKHLQVLLERHALSVPPNLRRALQRWEQYGSQARLERVSVLRVRDPEILQALRSSRAGRFLGDPLGPTAAIVNPGAWLKVQAALAEMGYLAEVIKEETPEGSQEGEKKRPE